MDKSFEDTRLHDLIKIEMHRNHWRATLADQPHVTTTSDSSANCAIGELLTKFPSEIAAAAIVRLTNLSIGFTEGERRRLEESLSAQLKAGTKVRLTELAFATS